MRHSRRRTAKILPGSKETPPDLGRGLFRLVGEGVAVSAVQVLHQGIELVDGENGCHAEVEAGVATHLDGITQALQIIDHSVQNLQNLLSGKLFFGKLLIHNYHFLSCLGLSPLMIVLYHRGHHLSSIISQK